MDQDEACLDEWRACTSAALGRYLDGIPLKNAQLRLRTASPLRPESIANVAALFADPHAEKADDLSDLDKGRLNRGEATTSGVALILKGYSELFLAGNLSNTYARREAVNYPRLHKYLAVHVVEHEWPCDTEPAVVPSDVWELLAEEFRLDQIVEEEPLAYEPGCHQAGKEDDEIRAGIDGMPLLRERLERSQAGLESVRRVRVVFRLLREQFSSRERIKLEVRSVQKVYEGANLASAPFGPRAALAHHLSSGDGAAAETRELARRMKALRLELRELDAVASLLGVTRFAKDGAPCRGNRPLLHDLVVPLYGYLLPRTVHHLRASRMQDGKRKFSRAVENRIAEFLNFLVPPHLHPRMSSGRVKTAYRAAL